MLRASGRAHLVRSVCSGPDLITSSGRKVGGWMREVGGVGLSPTCHGGPSGWHSLAGEAPGRVAGVGGRRDTAARMRCGGGDGHRADRLGDHEGIVRAG